MRWTPASAGISSRPWRRERAPEGRVIATTLPAYEGFLFERWPAHIGKRWTLPVRNSRGKTRHGLQYCPLCLSSEEPYYKRTWRLSIITICSEHRVQLLDRCTECGSPVSFNSATSGRMHHPPSDRMTFCYSCRADLRRFKSGGLTPVSGDEISFQSRMEAALREGWIEIPGTWSGRSVLFFPVIQQLMLMLARLVSAELGKNLDWGRWGSRLSFTFTGKRRELTWFDVSERRALMNIVRRLLTNWPEDFINFCATYAIPFYNLSWRSLRSDPAPFWFWTVINERMRQTLYEPPREEIESAISYLKKLKSRYSRWPRPYPKEMKAISEFLNTSSRLKRQIRKTSGVSVIRRGDKKMRPQPMSDALWEKLEYLITSRSRPLKIDAGVRRRLLDGIFYILYTGCPWEAMPVKFGAYKSARSMYYHLRRKGLFEQIWGAFMILRAWGI
jgi:transposase